MPDPFTVRVTARGYEADANAHVAGVVLLQYGQHARWEVLRSAGIDHADLRARGISPVSLEEQIRFHAEVFPGDELRVSCKFLWGERKTFRVEQQIRRSEAAWPPR